MKCRDLLRTSVITSAVLFLNFEDLRAVLSTDIIAVEKVPDMVAVMGREPEVMLDKALEALGSIGSSVKEGQKIVIKPSTDRDRSPELVGSTNPKLAKALVKRYLEAGASKVTVFDHTYDNWQKYHETSGIAEAVKEAGGTIMPANGEKYSKEVPIPGGANPKSTEIHKALIETDAWINVSVLKNHSGAEMTCAMKSYMGIVWDRRFFY